MKCANYETKSRMNYSELSSLQSKTIDCIRFPLVVMVVFIHMNPNVVNLPDAKFDFFSMQGLYNFVGILFSHTLPSIAVPTFFFISGFLFFINIQDWSWNKYKKKLKNRIKTLLIPYLMWNLVPFLFSIILIVFFRDKSMDEVIIFTKKYSWHIFYDCFEWGGGELTGLEII